MQRSWMEFVFVVLSFCLIFTQVEDVFAQREGNRRGERNRREENRGRNRRNGPPIVYRTDVPVHEYDLILGEPTQTTITVSLLAYEDMEGFVVYGVEEEMLKNKTSILKFSAGEPQEFSIDGLASNTRYFYRLQKRKNKTDGFVASDLYTFHTQRPPGSAFVFTLQADPHLDGGTSPELYEITVGNALAARPDFHIDLGDTYVCADGR